MQSRRICHDLLLLLMVMVMVSIGHAIVIVVGLIHGLLLLLLQLLPLQDACQQFDILDGRAKDLVLGELLVGWMRWHQLA